MEWKPAMPVSHIRKQLQVLATPVMIQLTGLKGSKLIVPILRSLLLTLEAQMVLLAAVAI